MLGQAVLSVLLSAGIVYPDDEAASLFVPLEYRYTGGRYEDELFGYRLYVPSEADHLEKYPLIVWLHGHGEGGTKNNREQLAWMQLIFEDSKHLDYPPFYVLATQCPPNNRSWFHRSGGPAERSSDDKGDEPLTILREIIDKTIEEFAIDWDRIYLAGVSSGGAGCWEMAIRYPDLFAAVAPLAGREGGDIRRLDRITDVPVWAFHSEDDFPEQVRKTVRVLKELGGRCCLTEVPGESHYCQTDAFVDYDLLGWLLSQRRGDPHAPKPGTITWASRWRLVRRDYFRWDFLLAVTFVPAAIGLCILAARNEIRRRKKLKNQGIDQADDAEVANPAVLEPTKLER